MRSQPINRLSPPNPETRNARCAPDFCGCDWNRDMASTSLFHASRRAFSVSDDLGCKTSPHLRISGRDFYYITALHPAKIDIIVHVDHTRRLGRDSADLLVGLRKHPDWTRFRNIQLGQERLEIAMLPLFLSIAAASSFSYDNHAKTRKVRLAIQA